MGKLVMAQQRANSRQRLLLAGMSLLTSLSGLTFRAASKLKAPFSVGVTTSTAPWVTTQPPGTRARRRSRWLAGITLRRLALVYG